MLKEDLSVGLDVGDRGLVGHAPYVCGVQACQPVRLEGIPLREGWREAYHCMVKKNKPCFTYDPQHLASLKL